MPNTEKGEASEDQHIVAAVSASVSSIPSPKGVPVSTPKNGRSNSATESRESSSDTEDGAGPAKRAKISHESVKERAERKRSSEDEDWQESGSEDESDDDEGEEGEEEDDSEGDEREEGEERERGDANPPLPPGPPPGSTASAEDDGWQAIWDEQHQAYYFYNSITGESTWTNPRVPEASAIAPGVAGDAATATGTEGVNGYYTATGAPDPYAAAVGEEGESGPTYYQLAHGITDPSTITAEDIANTYGATGSFNRFTGKWQPHKNPEQYNDENKARRQMEFYFDVDAAANSHDGRSLKAERQMKKLTKKELKAFREKRREKKEQKRRAWLKD